MTPVHAVTETSARSHFWIGKSKGTPWHSLCGLTRFGADLRYGFTGYEVCERCKRSPRYRAVLAADSAQEPKP